MRLSIRAIAWARSLRLLEENQSDGLSSHGFFSPDDAEMFHRLRFHVNIVGGDSEYFRNFGLHFREIGQAASDVAPEYLNRCCRFRIPFFE